MITLKKISIQKYKCFSKEQVFDVDPLVTVVVGMNESGKSALLESIAKTNYFLDDPKFKYDVDYVYPRGKKRPIKKLEKYILPLYVNMNSQNN